ncbi:MAG: hypothetical protein J6U86_03710 [Clostridia bacterium]|nr:hypothetical protein [Clostridia bacterium]
MKSDTVNPISFSIAFGAVIPICLLAILISGIIISVANDVYAFVKPDAQIDIVIDTAYDAKAFSKLLQSKGVIKNAFVFELYLRSKSIYDISSLKDSELNLNSNMSYSRLLDEIFKH